MEGFVRELDATEEFFDKYEINVWYYTGRLMVKLQNPTGIKTSLAAWVGELRSFILKELGERLFMFIPVNEAKNYGAAALFGSEVAERFPKANKEITEAGNCFATGSYTACVFHLMRAVEYGARKLMITLNARQYLRNPKRPIELCEWGDIATALEKAVNGLSAGTATSMAKKNTFEYYSHAADQFRNFKDAWRNNVSHTRKTYMAGGAQDVMDNTRQFMQHLALRLREGGK